MSDRPISISGGAGPFEAAAIAAVIQHILDREDIARAELPPARVPAAWVRSGAPKPFGRFNPPVLPEWGANAP